MRKIFLLLFLAAPCLIFALTYDSGSAGSSSSDNVTVENLTVNGNTVLGSNGADTFDLNVTSAAVDNAFGLNISTTTNGSGTSILMLDGANRRVGVNDTTPDAALDVGGSFQTDGNVTLGDAVTDVVTFNALPTLPSNAAPRTNITPTVVGQLILNTGPTPDEICFSTGTTPTTWVQIRSSITACSN